LPPLPPTFSISPENSCQIVIYYYPTPFLLTIQYPFYLTYNKTRYKIPAFLYAAMVF
jgi:hypothetical protein